jgi:type IV pilus assembly protein PilE
MKMLHRLPAIGRTARGFSLLEVMIVAAIFAILTAIALPSYRDFVRRGNRADAKAVLMETAQFMDRYFTTNGNFTGAAVLSTVSPKGATGTNIRYLICFPGGTTCAPPGTPGTSTFTVQAVPQNSQVGDKCGTLTLTNTGAQTAATSDCW